MTLNTDLLKSRLQPPAGQRLYAIVDASVNQLALDYLYEQDSLSFDCLLPGDLESDVFEVAPFLVSLKDQPEVLDWLLEGWGEHWLSFVHSPVPLDELQVHLRQFTKIRTDSGQAVFFRFFDPRVLVSVVPTLSADQAGQFFEHIDHFICESADGSQVVRVSFDGAQVSCSNHPII